MTQLHRNVIALSFDVEEFDLPTEYGVEIPFETQIEVTTHGLERILNLLRELEIHATFFCTAAYAKARPDMIRRIVKDGHELASHSYHHSKFRIEDLILSKTALQEISGTTVVGYRSPRMGEVSAEELTKAGYKWDSSLNPCWLPGRYNNSSQPRRPFVHKCGLVELPASVSPDLRLPLFWLAIHNMPMAIYKHLSRRALHQNGHLNLYMHPWEFSLDLQKPEYKVPLIIRRNSGEKLAKRLKSIIVFFKNREHRFVRLSEIANLTAK